MKERAHGLHTAIGYSNIVKGSIDAIIEKTYTTAKRETLREALELAPGFQNSVTGKVSYDLGVMEYMARITHLESELTPLSN